MKTFFQACLFALVLGGGASAHAAVVLNQILSPASYPEYNGDASQRYTDPGYTYANCAVVDDFTVTGSTLDLTSVSAVITGFGYYFTSFSNVSNWEVAIYSSLNAAHTNTTGNVLDVTVPVSSATVSGTFVANGDHNALLTLPVNLLLPAAGTYYLGIMAQNSIYANGEVGIYDAGTAGNGNAYYVNPGGSTLFGDQTEVALNQDAAYAIIGGPAAVPEPSAWMMLAAGGTVAALLARRRAKT